MTIKITPRLIDLTYEAVLKSYWRRDALRKFLRASHIAENFISSWAKEESKREILDRLFQKIQPMANGKKVILQMARSLSEQTSFPDLKNWEDSTQKINDAKLAIKELKSYLKSQNADIENENEKKEQQKRGKIQREKIQRALTDKNKLQTDLNGLHSKVGTQEGGYEFEKWFYKLLDFCEITNKKPYITGGRQIDGSLTLDGTTYILELKYTGRQSDATDIDSLKAKVNKMADNTMGILISISGYSSVAIEDASGSKTTLMLLDANHLYQFLTGGMSFADIILRVRRHVSQTGEAYLPIGKFNT